MKAVLLAAGKGKRCWPLTATTPKPMLRVVDKPLIAHALDSLEGLVNEAIIVVGYKAEQIIDFVGKHYRGIKIRYVEQKEQLGSAHAISLVKQYIKDRFIVMNTDDIYDKKDLERCIDEELAILASEVSDPRRFGVIMEKQGVLEDIKEKPKRPKSNLVNAGVYVLNRKIFPCIDGLKPGHGGEYQIVDAIKKLTDKAKIRVVRTEHWFPVGYAWDLLDVSCMLLKKLNFRKSRKARVHPNCTLKKTFVIEAGTEIKEFCSIEGPVYIGRNCEIGPHCCIRPYTVIGDGCKIGRFTEIKASVIFDGTAIPHHSYIGDSVIGKDVNFGAGAKIANLRHDGKEIVVKLHGKKIKTNRKKLGAIVGDKVKFGINCSINCGTLIAPTKQFEPGTFIKGTYE